MYGIDVQKGVAKMNRMIKKIACAVMAFTLMAGVFTGCKANKTSKVDLPQFTSVKDAEGNLPEKGKINDMEYSILSKDQFGCYNKDRGYYIDMLEQLDSPYFIIISAGKEAPSGTDIRIADFGMKDSTLVIVVEEYKDSKVEYKDLNCPCAVLEVTQMPADLLIVSTTGEQFNAI